VGFGSQPDRSERLAVGILYLDRPLSADLQSAIQIPDNLSRHSCRLFPGGANVWKFNTWGSGADRSRSITKK